jgi:hypothetical protein
MKDRIKDIGECSRGTQSPSHIDITRLLHQKNELNKENDQLDKESGEACVNTFEREIDKIIKDFSTELYKRKDINLIKDIDLIKELLKKSCDSLELDKLESDSQCLLESEKDLLKSDKSLLEKERDVCDQGRSILLEVRMLCYNWQKYGKHNQSGQETYDREEDLLRQLGDLGREFQTWDVRRNLYKTQNKLKSSDLSKEQRTNLECSRKVLQGRWEVLQQHTEVLQKLYDQERELRNHDLSPEERKNLQELQLQSKILENRSKTLGKHYEVMQKWWEMLQTVDKIEHVLKKADQPNENTDLDDHSKFLEKCRIRLTYHNIGLNHVKLHIEDELEYSKELYDKEMFLRNTKELEKCFVKQERRLDDLVKYVTFCQKDFDCLIKMYDQYKTDIEEPTGLERPLDLLEKYSQVASDLLHHSMPMSSYDLTKELYKEDMAEKQYKYNKTSYDLLLIYGNVLQDLLDNQNKLEPPDLLPKEHEEYREIQNSICEKACKIGEKQMPILRDVLSRPESRWWSEKQQTLFNIATVQLDYLKDLWQQKSAMSNAFAENPENMQTVIQQYRDWKAASQEREKWLNLLAEYPEIKGKRVQLRTEMRYLAPSSDEYKRCDTSIEVLQMLEDNLRYLAADCCKSDNDEHLQKMKSSRVKLIEALKKFHSDLSSRPSLKKLEERRNRLNEWRVEHNMDKYSSLPSRRTKLLKSIDKLEKSYANWEKRTLSTSSSSSNTNRSGFSFRWPGFR